jgi:hypothetical protein
VPLSVYGAAFNWLSSYMYQAEPDPSPYSELWKACVSTQYTKQLESVVRDRAGITGEELTATKLQSGAAARGAVSIVAALASGGQLDASHAREASR